MSPDRQRFDALLMELTPEQLEGMCDQPALAYGRSQTESAWLLHAAIRLGKGRILIISGFHRPLENDTLLKACEVNLNRKTAVVRQPDEQELKLMQARPYQAEFVSEDAYQSMVLALTGNAGAGMTRH